MIFDIFLVSVLIICCITDLKERKIYNKVLFPALASVFLLHLIINGIYGLTFSLLGFLAGLSILLVPFMLGGFGAGDVKLLALVGAIKGSIFAVNTALYMFIIGGAIAFVIIISHKETLNFLKGLFRWFIGLFRGSYYKLELPTTPLLKVFPYSVAISGGAIIGLIFKGAAII